jgi:hypothetical protein
MLLYVKKEILKTCLPRCAMLNLDNFAHYGMEQKTTMFQFYLLRISRILFFLQHLGIREFFYGPFQVSAQACIFLNWRKSNGNQAFSCITEAMAKRKASQRKCYTAHVD